MLKFQNGSIVIEIKQVSRPLLVKIQLKQMCHFQQLLPLHLQDHKEVFLSIPRILVKAWLPQTVF